MEMAQAIIDFMQQQAQAQKHPYPTSLSFSLTPRTLNTGE